MDINDHPGFADTYAGIKRSFGEEWARRFVLAAPLMIGDPTSPLYGEFLQGLAAHADGRLTTSALAWERCQTIMQELALSLVAEAEALLGAH